MKNRPLNIRSVFTSMMMFVCSPCLLLASDFVVVADGKAKAVIAVGADSTVPEKNAVALLAKYLGKVTGAEFTVVGEDAVKAGTRAIYVGQTKFAAGQGIDFSTLDREEWVIRSVGSGGMDALLISGGRPRGVLYGVLEFLEWQATLHARHRRQISLSMKLLSVLFSCMLVCFGELRAADYFSPAPVRFKATGFFRLATTQGRDHLVTPDGRAYVALGVNHIGSLQQEMPGSVTVRGNAAWEAYWEAPLRARFADWNFTTLGYGAPTILRAKAPWFGTITVSPIEKHRSEPKLTSRDGYEFPDVFDPAWEAAIQETFAREVAPLCDDPMLVGWFWTDTPTWDVLRTRALRSTEWVSVVRTLPAGRPGREAYAAFLNARYANRLADLNAFYGLSLGSFAALRDADLSHVAVGRHVVQEDDRAFLGVIARRYYEVVGKAQRRADPNHLVFGDRYLAGDHPEEVLQAVKPWIDAVAVQPGDRYSPLYPASTEFPNPETQMLHTVTGKPVLICDHAISFPSAAHPLTIFEQMPDEPSAAKATGSFLAAAFAKPWMLGYLRCQYIDRPAGFGRGLRQGLLQGDGTPRGRIVSVYRKAFGDVLKEMNELAP